jgi:hypothetical protein
MASVYADLRRLLQGAGVLTGLIGYLIVAGAGIASCTELESGVPNHYEVIEVRSVQRP